MSGLVPLAAWLAIGRKPHVSKAVIATPAKLRRITRWFPWHEVVKTASVGRHRQHRLFDPQRSSSRQSGDQASGGRANGDRATTGAPRMAVMFASAAENSSFCHKNRE